VTAETAGARGAEGPPGDGAPGLAEGAVGRVAELAARLFDTPIAVVCVADATGPRVVAQRGLAGAAAPGAAAGLCAAAIRNGAPQVIEDATRDAEARADPLVAAPDGVRFAAAAPIRGGDGRILGALCVMDRAPRTFAERDRALLASLAGIAADQLALRGPAPDRPAAPTGAAASREMGSEFRTIAQALPQIVWTATPDGTVDFASDAFFRLVGWTDTDLAGDAWLKALHPDDRARCLYAWRAAVAEGRAYASEFRLRSAADGGWRWHLAAASPVRDADGRIVKWYGTTVDVHERVQAEAALRSQNAGLREQTTALLAVMRAGLLRPSGFDEVLHHITEVAARTVGVARASVWTLTPDRSVLLCNDAFHAATGRHETGTELPVTGHPDYLRALAGNDVIAAADALADPRTASLAADYLHPHGIGAMLDTPIIADGDLIGVLCLEHVGGARAWTEADRGFALALANLVALVLVQAERMQSESRLRSILESEPECVKVVSPSGHLVEMNPAGLAMIEADDLASVRGLAVADLVHPDDRSIFLDLHAHALEGGSGHAQFRVIGLKGTPRWLETNATPLRRPDGSIEAVLSIARDVTKRRRAEEALAESQQRNRMILETIGEGVLGLDAEGNVLFQNPAAVAMLGWTEDEALGRQSHALVHHHRADGSAFPRDECPIHRSLRDGVTRRVDDEVFFRKDGSSFPVEYVCAPMKRADGSIAGAVVTFRDISERVRGERLRLAETAIFDLISSGAALPEVLERIALMKEQALPGVRVTVFLVDRQGRRLQLGAAPNLLAYAKAVEGVRIDTEIGSCGAAVLRGRRVISADVEADPLWRDCLELARAHGLRACWSTPVLDMEGRPVAVVAAHFDHPRAPTEDELAVIDRAARLVSLAIERVRSLEALRKSEATFRETFRDAATGIAVAAPDGRILEVNEAFARIVGYAQEELRGLDLQMLTPPDDLERTRQLRDELLAGQRDSYVREKRYRTKQGGLVWVRNSVAMRRDPSGRAINAIVVTEDITPQKAAEQELRQSQALLQVASRIGQLGGWEIRLPGREMIWSEQVSRIHGLAPGAVPSVEEAIAFYAPEHRETIRAAFEACAGEGTPWDLELELITAQGSRIWVRTIGEAVRDPYGKIIAVQGALQDISERRQAEALLRESERRFHAVASVTADVVWDWDLRTDRVWWSDDFAAAFGYPPEAVEPDVSSWLNRIHPDDRERVLAGIRAVIDARGSSWSEEYRFLHADGSVLDIEDRGMLILGADGAPIRFVGGMSDITERKRFQRELRERIRELQCLYRVLELTTDETRPVDAICADVVAMLPGSLQHGEHAVARIRIDGSEHRSPAWQKPSRALSAPVRAEGKQIGEVEIGYPAMPPGLAAGQDPFLAEERALIEAIATHVGRMIHDRRIGETLRQGERLRAVGELTGGIAHDFNNLLTVILGNTELLAEELEDRPTAQSLALVAQGAAENAAELTKRLLAFSRRQALDARATDIGGLVRGMKALLRRTLGEHIDIRIVEPAGLWQALVDPPQLESAILNLCINARDAMPAGGTLTIEVANVDLDASYAEIDAELQPGPYVMVAISDTGTGMSPEVLARAFDPFFTTKEVGKGSGLGLSMVWGFVKQSKGHVKIYSEPGLGTTVKLYLPRAGAEAGRGAAHGRPAGMLRGSERILLVEDDELVRAHVAMQLEQLGYRVACAGSGPEALATLARDQDFDLLFTDIVMPGGMNGRQLAEEARRRLPGLRVLFTSGYTEQAMLHQGSLGAGMRLLAKPYRRQELALRVREALDEARTPTAPAP
jgi:PAS domain S-box-containing protein